MINLEGNIEEEHKFDVYFSKSLFPPVQPISWTPAVDEESIM